MYLSPKTCQLSTYKSTRTEETCSVLSLLFTNLVELYNAVVDKPQHGLELVDVISVFAKPLAARLHPRLILTQALYVLITIHCSIKAHLWSSLLM